MSDAEKIAEVLAELGYVLERREHPNDVRQWPLDEAGAYRDNGGFREGRDAAYALREKKLHAALEPAIREREKKAFDHAWMLLTGDACRINHPYDTKEEA